MHLDGPEVSRKDNYGEFQGNHPELKDTTMRLAMQAQIELDVFRDFVSVVTRPILPETISHREPPEPDIVCEIAGEGIVGFELTELIDHQFMARLDLKVKTEKSLSDFWKSELSTPESNSFKAKYGNAHLIFRFSSDVGYRERLTVLDRIFEELLTLPSDYIGDALKNDTRFAPTLVLVRIRRGNFIGPIIGVDSFGWLGNPAGNTISKKLSKIYQCAYPVELLAYVDWDLLPPEGVWKTSVNEAAALEGSQIRRVWVFDRMKKQVLYVNPER